MTAKLEATTPDTELKHKLASAMKTESLGTIGCLSANQYEKLICGKTFEPTEQCAVPWSLIKPMEAARQLIIGAIEKNQPRSYEELHNALKGCRHLIGEQYGCGKGDLR